MKKSFYIKNQFLNFTIKTNFVDFLFKTHTTNRNSVINSFTQTNTHIVTQNVTHNVTHTLSHTLYHTHIVTHTINNHTFWYQIMLIIYKFVQKIFLPLLRIKIFAFLDKQFVYNFSNSLMIVTE